MTGFEGNLSAYLSESTRIDFNWLYTDAEFTGDAMIVDYLNPGAWTGPYGGYMAVDDNGLGLMYMATGSNGVTVFKSAGFSCLTPNFNPLLGIDCPSGFEGVEQNVKGNKLPGTPELSYSLSLNKRFTSSMGTFDFRLTHRFQDSFAGDAFNSERLFNDEQEYLDLMQHVYQGVIPLLEDDDFWKLGKRYHLKNEQSLYHRLAHLVRYQ